VYLVLFIFFLFLLGVADLELPEVLDSVFLQSVRQVAAIFAVKVFNPDLFLVSLLCCWVKLACPEQSLSFFFFFQLSFSPRVNSCCRRLRDLADQLLARALELDFAREYFSAACFWSCSRAGRDLVPARF
jgi:hypothetical protein